MKNFDRFTEPDNYIDQSGKLIKLKRLALIAAVGIALLFFLSGCESQRAANKTAWLKKKGYMIDSVKTETKFIQGEIRLLKDTTYISSSDTLRSDSTTVITHHYYKEKHFYQKDTLIINNSKTIHVEHEGTNVVPWWYWLILSGMGVVIFGLTFRK